VLYADVAHVYYVVMLRVAHIHADDEERVLKTAL